MDLISTKYPKLLDPEYVAAYDLEGSYTRTHPNGEYLDEDVAVAILRFDGNLSRAARTLGRYRNSLANFVARNGSLSELLAEVQDAFLDELEDTYRQTALKGDDQAIRFFLTTKGKKRGYSTRVEQTGEDGGPVKSEVALDWSGMTDEQLEAMYGAIKAGERTMDQT